MSDLDPSSDAPMEITRQCIAHKKNGDRCRKSAVRGATVCGTHGGSAPQVRAAAQRRLLAAADGLMANLIKIAMSGESEANRLRATMDALSRAGLVERHMIHVGTSDPFADVLAGILDDGVLVDSPDRPALPSGAGAVHHDEDWDPTPEEAGDDLGPDDLSFHTEDTIVGEVVHEVTTLPRPTVVPEYIRREMNRQRGRGDYSR